MITNKHPTSSQGGYDFDPGVYVGLLFWGTHNTLAKAFRLERKDKIGPWICLGGSPSPAVNPNVGRFYEACLLLPAIRTLLWSVSSVFRPPLEFVINVKPPPGLNAFHLQAALSRLHIERNKKKKNRSVRTVTCQLLRAYTDRPACWRVGF